jgi:hypothetical protein
VKGKEDVKEFAKQQDTLSSRAATLVRALHLALWVIDLI